MKHRPKAIPVFTDETEANRRDVPYQSLIKIWLAEKAGSN